MRAVVWNAESAPEHHADQLVFRVHPIDGTRRAVPDTAALRHLLELERRGHLHGVHAMDGGALGGRHARVEAAMARAHRHHDAAHAHTGTVLVHLRHARHREALLARLRADARVAWAARVPARFIATKADAPMPSLRDWHHGAVRLAEARGMRGFREPRAVTVAVLDTGVDAGHPALRGRVARYVPRLGAYAPGAADIVGHGTHVSGIIAAAANDMQVTGMCHPRLEVYKIFSEDTYIVHDTDGSYRVYLVDSLAYRAALHRCLATGVDVINLSIGGTGAPDPHEHALLEALIARGTVVVAAMGNSTAHRRRKSYPAAVPGVIAVGAVDAKGRIADFSCVGDHITLCAPGVDIWSTLPRQPGGFGYAATRSGRRAEGANPLARNVRFDSWPGTSMACPQVTAAVAMLLATRGRMTPAAVRRRLMRTATRLAAMQGASFTPTYGAGRLDVARLLADRRR